MIKLVIKGVLLYVTTFSIMLLLCGIDSIIEGKYLFHWILFSFIMVCICKKCISKRDFIKLTFNESRKDTEI